MEVLKVVEGSEGVLREAVEDGVVEGKQLERMGVKGF